MSRLPRCPLCDYDIEIGQSATILRVGTDKVDEDSGEVRFSPLRFDDDDADKWFHENCFGEFMYCGDCYDDDKCLFNGCEMYKDVWYCQLENAVLERGPDGICMNAGGLAYCCWDCIFDGLGNGDALRARQILGMDDGGEDDLTLFDTVPEHWNDKVEEERPKRRGPPKKKRAFAF